MARGIGPEQRARSVYLIASLSNRLKNRRRRPRCWASCWHPLAGYLVVVVVVVVVAISGFSSSALAHPSKQAASNAAVPAEVSIANTKRIEFVSKVNGRRYSISLALPFEPAPPEGYGVLYVIDGNWYFGSAAEAVRNWNAPGVAVVGIGYPTDNAFVKSVLARYGKRFSSSPRDRAAQSKIVPGLERFFDLTLPVTDQELTRIKTKYKEDSSLNTTLVGGLDDYLKILETEIKPRVAAVIPIDRTNQVLFGDSFGGLAALHALFVEPNAFRTFIIGSPSIWWNDKAVLRDQAKFESMITAGSASPRVLVTMGALESTPPNPVPPSWNMDLATATEMMKASRMVENGRELVARLKTLHGSAGFEIQDYTVFDKLDHGTASWAALAWGIAFAFPKTP